MEMACHQAIFNQEKEKLLQLQMSLQWLKTYLSKHNSNLDLEKDSDVWFFW